MSGQALESERILSFPCAFKLDAYSSLSRNQNLLPKNYLKTFHLQIARNMDLNLWVAYLDLFYLSGLNVFCL